MFTPSHTHQCIRKTWHVHKGTHTQIHACSNLPEWCKQKEVEGGRRRWWQSSELASCWPDCSPPCTGDQDNKERMWNWSSLHIVSLHPYVSTFNVQVFFVSWGIIMVAYFPTASALCVWECLSVCPFVLPFHTGSVGLQWPAWCYPEAGLGLSAWRFQCPQWTGSPESTSRSLDHWSGICHPPHMPKVILFLQSY